MKKLLQVLIALALAVFAIMIFAPKALAFCGFYVAKADTKLYNQASQVIIARDGDRRIFMIKLPKLGKFGKYPIYNALIIEQSNGD